MVGAALCLVMFSVCVRHSSSKNKGPKKRSSKFEWNPPSLCRSASLKHKGFKQACKMCGKCCWFKIVVMHLPQICLTCLRHKHLKFHCAQCLALSWKARARFLREFLLGVLHSADKDDNKAPTVLRLWFYRNADSVSHWSSSAGWTQCYFTCCL